jgi:hypothetical protein
MKLEESFSADGKNRKSLVELLVSTNKFLELSARQSLVTEIGIDKNRYSFKDSDAHSFVVELIDFLIQGGHHSALNDLLNYLDKEKENSGDKDEISRLRSILEPIDPCELEEHYKQVVDALTKGKLIIFLGADVNLCDRQKGEWKPNPNQKSPPPIDREVAEYLSKKYRQSLSLEREELEKQNLSEICECAKKGIENLPDGCPLKDLQHITQFIDDTFGTMRLYETLNDVFKRDYTPNQIHKFVASIPNILRQAKDGVDTPSFVITTNYDDTLESAFQSLQEPEQFDSLFYIAKGRGHGKFNHKCPSGEKVIDRPETYMSLEQDSIVLKLYGTGNLVLTEEQNDDYPKDFFSKLPMILQDRLQSNDILFLGCNLNERKDRSIVRRMWKELRSHGEDANWWAVQLTSYSLGLWESQYSSMLIKQPLNDYVNGLDKQLRFVAKKEV